MMQRTGKFLASLVILFVVGFVAGCGGGGGGTDSGGDEGLSGSVNISGSSTVYPLTTAVAEEFQKEHPDISISVTRDGSSGGFENAFLPGRSDINNSSRPIHESEVEEAEEQGFDILEFQVAQDALTVVVNNENDFVGDCMDIKTLKEIWSPETPPETWQDVKSEWPAQELQLYGAASTSGTFDYFTSHVIGETGKIRSDFEGTEEDDLIAQGVEGSKYASGYFPFAYYMNNPDSVKALALDDGTGCVEPSLENASKGTYSLARPLFIYVNVNRLEGNKTLQEYLRTYIKLTQDRQLVAEDIGYVPMSESAVENNLQKLEDAIQSF